MDKFNLRLHRARRPCNQVRCPAARREFLAYVDATTRLNDTPAVGTSGCSRLGQKEPARQKVRLAPDGCYHHAGVLVAISMLARTLRFNNSVGASCVPEKEIPDGQDA